MTFRWRMFCTSMGVPPYRARWICFNCAPHLMLLFVPNADPAGGECGIGSLALDGECSSRCGMPNRIKTRMWQAISRHFSRNRGGRCLAMNPGGRVLRSAPGGADRAARCAWTPLDERAALLLGQRCVGGAGTRRRGVGALQRSEKELHGRVPRNSRAGSVPQASGTDVPVRRVVTLCRPRC